MKCFGATDRHRTNCVAVIGIGKSDEFALFWLADVEPILRGQLERHLCRRRPAVAVKNFRQPASERVSSTDPPDSVAGSLAKPSIVVCATLPQLCDDGRINLRHTMAVHVAPQTADTIEITLAVAVDQMHSLGSDNHKRIAFRPQTFIGVNGMPDVLAIEVDQDVACRRTLDGKCNANRPEAARACVLLFSAIVRNSVIATLDCPRAFNLSSDKSFNWQHRMR